MELKELHMALFLIQCKEVSGTTFQDIGPLVQLLEESCHVVHVTTVPAQGLPTEAQPVWRKRKATNREIT